MTHPSAGGARTLRSAASVAAATVAMAAAAAAGLFAVAGGTVSASGFGPSGFTASAPQQTSQAAPTAAVRVEASAPHMGTLVRIVVHAPDREAGDAAIAAAFARIAEIEARLSDYRDDSEVAALSRAAAGTPVPVSGDLSTILDASADIARRTGGAFDVTAGRLTHLWRRARRTNVWPDADRVTAARAGGGYEQVHLDAARRTVTLQTAGIEIDPGGIAKGYAADEALRVLAARGIRSALVGLGGDLAASDPPPGQAGWRVAIPRLAAADTGSRAAAQPFWIELAHAAVSTSGDAEQWMTVAGVRRSHVIDLRTGWPLTGRTATSVVARRGIDADALSTAVAIVDRATAAALLADRDPAAPAQALWQRLRENGRTDVQFTAQWPASPRPVAITTRGTR